MVWTRGLHDLRPRHQENLIFMKTACLSLFLGGTTKCGLLRRFLYVSLPSFSRNSTFFVIVSRPLSAHPEMCCLRWTWKTNSPHSPPARLTRGPGGIVSTPGHPNPRNSRSPQGFWRGTTRICRINAWDCSRKCCATAIVPPTGAQTQCV